VLLAAMVLRRSEREVVRLLREQVPLERLNPVRRWALRRLVRNGAATLLDEGRYALIPDGYAAFRRRRRLRALGVFTLMVLALLGLWLRGVL
jgi:hypothetical protein